MVSLAGRVRKVNQLYKGDFQPAYKTGIPKFLTEPTPPVPDAVAIELDLPVNASDGDTASMSCTPGVPEMITAPDKFGVYRVYRYLPSVEPDEEIKPEHLADSPLIAGAEPRSRPGWWVGLGSVAQTVIRQRTTAEQTPFLNPTTMALMRWFYQTRTSTQSLSHIERLVDEVIFSKDWDREELRGFKAHKANVAYDKARKAQEARPDASQDVTSELPFASEDGWHQSYVQFYVPKEGWKSRDNGMGPKHMTVGPVWHRKIMTVLTDAIQNPRTGTDMHLTPFRMYWSPDAARDDSTSSPPSPPTPTDASSSSSSPSPSSSSDDSTSSTSSTSFAPHGGERLYGEVYIGDAMNREHEEIRQNLPKTPGKPNPETVVAAILLYSDSTHLAQFGKASLWPAYGWFANWTKYDRGKPSSFAAHHLAYIPSVRSSRPSLPYFILISY